MATYSETDYSEPKTSAEIQREIELQRSRVENTIDQIQERLSPGQLVDELLSYTKSGGADFAASLGRSAAANPLPVALLGVSLAWLIAGPGKTPSVSGLFSRRDAGRDRSRAANRYSAYASYDDDVDLDDRLDEFDDTLADAFDDELEYAYAPIEGSSLRRSAYGTDEATGSRYAEFVDEAGKKFRAATDAVGNRAGHFRDEAGNTFRGFTDAAGNRVRHFRDETGNVISDAAGWASEKWEQGRRALHDARDAVSQGAGKVSEGVSSGVSALSSGLSSASRSASRAGRAASRAGVRAGRQVSDAGAYAGRRAAEIGETVGRQGAVAARRTADTLQEQPLVTGALAFAVGAAVGALLPHTRREDELLGDTADSVRAEAGRRAGEFYQAGKEKVSSLYGEATAKAGDVYQRASERAGALYDEARSDIAARAENLRDAASTAASDISAAASSGATPSPYGSSADENPADARVESGVREQARDI
jgi:ElaB/YqjD/DUF883 family membrane-anchored ribosome-binding protein